MSFRVFLIVIAVVGCRSRSEDAAKQTASPAPTPRFAAIDPPAAPGAMAPQLRSESDGVLATWLEPEGDGHRLVWSRWTRGAWSRPITISRGASILANWADVPSVARGTDGALVAHWAEKREGGKYAYDAIVARSADGNTWTRLGALHDDNTPTEHGFVSLIADGTSIRAFWLDGRATASGGAMTLQTATVTDSIGASTIVDDRVCDCCSTGVTGTSDGPLVAYRDRSAEEIRDIAIARGTAGTWSTTAVGRDDWKIEGCPVNGPAIAAAGQHVVVAWYTSAGDVHRVRVAFSADSGRTFAAPIDVDTARGERQPLGRVAVVLADDRSAIVSWLAARAPGASVLVRRVTASGGRGHELAVVSTSADRDAGFPRIARDGEDLIVAWTETSSPKRIRAVRLPTTEVPGIAQSP